MKEERFAPLDEVCLVEYGTRVVQKKDGGSIFPVYGGGGATFKMDTFNREDRLVVARFGMSEECTRFVSGKFFLNDSGLTVSPRTDGLLQRFLDYQLISLNDTIFALGKGSAQKNLDVPLFRAMQIYIPNDLAEQQRIVGILDAAFDGIATAKANAEQNLQNARALFESHLQSIFTQRGEGWEVKSLGELIESSLIGLTRSSKEQGINKRYPYVKMNHITRDNRFEFTDYLAVDASNDEAERFALRSNDFLFNTRNSHELVGKSCVYQPTIEGVVLFNNNIMRIRFQAGIDARFVLAAFSSSAVAEELEGLKSGTTNVSAIYFKDLRNLRIPVPSISVQRDIADKLDALRTETQRLESLYQRKLAALAELKQSLLHQAFSGAL